jgi:hypothetical protein
MQLRRRRLRANETTRWCNIQYAVLVELRLAQRSRRPYVGTHASVSVRGTPTDTLSDSLLARRNETLLRPAHPARTLHSRQSGSGLSHRCSAPCAWAHVRCVGRTGRPTVTCSRACDVTEGSSSAPFAPPVLHQVPASTGHAFLVCCARAGQINDVTRFRGRVLARPDRLRPVAAW